jgi:uncharacterized membrane protein YgcG
MNANRPRFAWRAMVSVLIAASFVILVLSGIILFVAPPGRIANWTNWTLLGLRKHDWIALHVCFSTLFLIGAVFHLVFNWRPLLNYFKDRLTRRVGFRWEWLAALAICGGVWAGTRVGVPPFSTLLAFSERVKEGWDQPRDRAPIPHAELLTLSELVEKAGVAMSTATNRLAARGITNASPDVVVRDLASLNARSAQQIYQSILAEPVRGGGGGGQKHGQGQGRGGGGGAGGGPGRKTLAEFCADEGIEVKAALARLEAKGLKASADLTLREIAVNNGYSRPYEIMDILRGK